MTNVQTAVENRLHCSEIAVNAALGTSVSFLPMFTLSDVKTDQLYSETTVAKVKTERRLTPEQIGTLLALEFRTAAHGQLNTRTLRVLEQRGLVGFAIGRQHWFIKAAGRQAIERLTA